MYGELSGLLCLNIFTWFLKDSVSTNLLLTLCSLVSKLPSSRVTVARANFIIRQQHAKKSKKLLLLLFYCYQYLMKRLTS